MSNDTQPEIRFPGFTEEWEEREFSEIVKTTGYKAYLSEAFEVGEYPVIQQGDKPILGYSDKKPFENFEDVVLFGDHTLSLYKPETPFLVATDGLKIITVPNFSGSFLLSLLEKYVPESQGYKRHFTILKKEQVAFPTDVKERVLIGEFFTQIDRTIILHERELDLLKETKKGFLQKMFPKNGAKVPEIRFPGFTEDWEQRKLGELATIVRGASPRPIQDPKWFDTESDVGWLRIADVTEQDGRIYYLEQHISKLGQEKTRVLVEPHLLLSIAATVGKPVVNYVKTGVHDGFLIFLNAIFDREFMFQWLEMFRPKWQKYGQPGSQVNLNSELVRNQEILIPNNEEQQKIGSFFKQLDTTITLHQRELDVLKETKKGFLQKMFV